MSLPNEFSLLQIILCYNYYRPSSPNPDRKLPKSVAISMQKFLWEPTGGYISCVDDPNLVFGVKEIESKVVDVILKRRHADDLFQRWVFLPLNEEENDLPMDFTKPL